MKEITRDLVILGGGPGGYTAAFRAADLGRKVTLIEKYRKLGGVCLNVGCIPSKTLLHLSEVIADAAALESAGVSFSDASINLDKIRNHKEAVVSELTSGLDSLGKARNIERIQGSGTLTSDSELSVKTEDETLKIRFTDLIIAVGSRPVQIPGIPYEDKRIWDSTR
ncbi:MAG: FAD-dependent oxidoreductase, partial [Spirochaetales bacterium]|nr:FAD-dependent oxidoreductase [Spirochaetales bacterium]